MRSKSGRIRRSTLNPILETLEPRRMLAADLAGSLSYTAGTYYPGQAIAGATLNEINVGSADADGFATQIVLSTDQTLGNSDDIEVARPERRGMPVTPGELARTVKSLSISSSMAAGRYYVIVKVDSLGQVTEDVETNNVWVSAAADVVVAKPSVTIAATDRTASEAGNNTGRIRFTRTGPTTDPLTVRYTVGGTADNTGGDADMTVLSGTVVIGANQASAVVVITPVDDTRVEGVERVVLTLAADDAYAFTAGASARVDINDNDGSRVRIAATDGTAAEEGAATGTFTVSRAGSLSGDLVVNYTVGGTAIGGTDYTALSGSVTIADGASSAAITLTPIDDVRGESVETVVVTLAASPWYLLVNSRRTARATIADNEPSVKIEATDASSSESATGATGTGTFRVTRTGASGQALVVSFTTSGTATSGSDYADLGGTVTIPAGALTATIMLAPTDDGAAEPIETAVLTLVAGDGYRVDASRPRATVNIADNEPVVSVVASDTAATENGRGTGAYTIMRTGTPAADLEVRFTLGGTAATDGTDYDTIATIVTIPAGQPSLVVTVMPVDDQVGEGSETVVLTLVARPAYSRNPTKTTARVTIADNEPSVSIVAARGGAASETAGADSAGEFEVTRTGASIGRLTVPYTVTGTAAMDGSDYTMLSGTVDILDGQSKATIVITPVDDGVAEPAETVIVTLGNGTGYILSNSRRLATVTIADNEPVVSIVATDATAVESGAGDAPGATFTISRAVATATDLTVPFTVGGTATNGSDYETIAASVTIPANQTSATVTLVTKQDTRGEGEETVELTLTTSTSYTVQTSGGRNTARATIRDDEPGVSVAATDATATEQDQTDGVFTLTRTGTADQLASPMTVRYRIEGSADPGDDYEALDGEVTFAAGAATVTVPVTAIDDSEGESGENVIITLEGGDDAEYVVDSARSSATVSITDNEPAVSVTATTANASESNRPGVFTVRRTGSSAEELVIAYTVSGTATAGTDYTALSGTVTIAAGVNTATVSVAPIYDLLTEESETVKITLGSGDGYKLDVAKEATVTIANAQAVDLNLLSVSYFGRSYSLASTGVNSPIVVNLSNMGIVTSGAFAMEFRLSSDTTWGDDDDVVIGSVTCGALAGGAGSTVVFDFMFDSVKSRLSAGNYYLACRIDPLARVLESSEANNTYFSMNADVVVTA